jgi:vancomycin resistance protein VanW
MLALHAHRGRADGHRRGLGESMGRGIGRGRRSSFKGEVSAVARLILGQPVRRIRREIQWRRPDIDFAVARCPSDYEYVAATHSTPLYRPLSGLDERLQRNKIVNLRIAADRLNGIVLQPGMRLSFWREVGKPSRRRGFVDGMVLAHGQIAAGVGGGLCQMTNLLFWMTLHTPLSIVERWRHSYDVFPDASRTQPFGSGATCAWPVLDLQIQNDTTVPYRLSIALTDTHLIGRWTAPEPSQLTYRIEERGHVVSHEGPGVYVRNNELWRIETDRQGREQERLVAANHARMMYEPFLPPVPEQVDDPTRGCQVASTG